MTNQALVSIVVPCYNAARHLRACLDSVLTQTHHNLECIVVDDGSTDNTREVVREYGEKDKRVKYFYKDNGGEASAKNYGLEKSGGAWVHVLDADDWIASEKIATQLEAGLRFRNESDFVLVYSDYEIVHEKPDQSDPVNVQIIVGELSRAEILRRIVCRKRGLSMPSPISLNSMLLSRNIFDHYKMNEKMPNIADLELYYRILQDDVQCIYAPGISMYYRQHDTNISRNSLRSLVGYTMFLDTIYRTNKRDLECFPNLDRMLRQSVLQEQPQVYKSLVHLLNHSNIPVYVNLFGKERNVHRFYRILARLGLMRVWVKGSALVSAVKRQFAKAVHH